MFHLDRGVKGDLVVLEDHESGHFHLIIGKVEAKTSPRSPMEGKELVGPNALGAVIRPAVRVKDKAILTPQGSQAVKDVGLVKHIRAGFDLTNKQKEKVKKRKKPSRNI
jgi:hypothetical protein